MFWPNPKTTFTYIDYEFRFFKKYYFRRLSFAF